MGWYYRNYYPKQEPKKVKDGIRLQGKDAGSTWWSKRWISALQSFGWSDRLSRGRTYARKGQVMDFKIEPGEVTAKVQGTRKEPYSIKINLKVLQDKEWEIVLNEISKKAGLAASLLIAEMPEDIEDTFRSIDVPLFPEEKGDLKTSCSCPDWANPCKHIAATHYILADEFDRDPFMIFRLRGREKQEIIDYLRRARTKEEEKEIKEIEDDLSQTSATSVELETQLDRFWKMPERLDSIEFNISNPEVELALFKRLGPLPFWRGKPDFWKEMKGIYSILTKISIQSSLK